MMKKKRASLHIATRCIKPFIKKRLFFNSYIDYANISAIASILLSHYKNIALQMKYRKKSVYSGNKGRGLLDVIREYTVQNVPSPPRKKAEKQMIQQESWEGHFHYRMNQTP